LPLVTPEAVKHVAEERAVFGESRVIEVVGGIPVESDLLHDTLGTLVHDGRERDDLFEADVREAEFQARSRPLLCVTAPPHPICQPPPDLDTGREWECCWIVLGEWPEAYVAHKRLSTPNLHGPQPVADLIEQGVRTIGEGVALLSRELTREEFHHGRVAVHRRERPAVFGPPPSEGESLGDERGTRLDAHGRRAYGARSWLESCQWSCGSRQRIR